MSDAGTDLLKKYVRPNQPFGPVDATDVTEPMCAAALYDWNNQAFAELLVGSDVLVGRRGSGKSSLLRSFPAKKFLHNEFQSDEGREFRDRHHISAKVLARVPEYVVEVDTPLHVTDLEGYCTKLPVLPPVEIMASIWKRRLWWLVGLELKNADGLPWKSLPNALKNYIESADIHAMVDGSRREVALGADEFIVLFESFLLSHNIKVVVTFDNVERHKFEHAQNCVLAGLIAATGKFINS